MCVCHHIENRTELSVCYRCMRQSEIGPLFLAMEQSSWLSKWLLQVTVEGSKNECSLKFPLPVFNKYSFPHVPRPPPHPSFHAKHASLNAALPLWNLDAARFQLSRKEGNSRRCANADCFSPLGTRNDVTQKEKQLIPLREGKQTPAALSSLTPPLRFPPVY